MTHVPVDQAIPATADLVLYASRMVHTLRRSAIVPPPHLRVLALLDEHGPTGVSRLAELDSCTQPSVSTMVATLHTRGLVTKRADPHDARAGLVELTEQGREQLRSARLDRGRTVEAALDSLDPAQRPSPEDIDIAVSVLRSVTGALLAERATPGRL
ncbi:MarR family winged helix-turn-helix transcriptional regulator [Millisia brevis]|uniref:MarR family winged helix-turn-helix transcriptional regulator n=1 Tax=Millisia brevis TaxID=264148 RepID=UPI0014721D99|nr:MarR family transcriptional regulator [Millisia brevis]